jgi:hypothetical protein
MLAVNHPEVLGTLGERTHMPQKNTDGVLVVKERPNLVMLLLEHRRALKKHRGGPGCWRHTKSQRRSHYQQDYVPLCGRCSEIKTLDELHIAKADFLRR